MQIVSRLHGELLAGAWGSYIVEIAACWTLVMILTGLYLWWPRGRKGLAGVLYPRLSGGRRLFWRDLHAVTGIWVSLLALFVIATGLPWAKAWGSYFKEIRTVTGTLDGPVDWTIGGRKPADDPMLGDHAGHMGMARRRRGNRAARRAAGARLAAGQGTAPLDGRVRRRGSTVARAGGGRRHHRRRARPQRLRRAPLDRPCGRLRHRDA
jgi:uncharacterized iron-regulated membrane protein